MAATFIYALCEPGTRTVRYIGKTRYKTRRYQDHLKVSSKKKSHLGNWLRSLTLPPEFVILRETESNGCQEEIRYIDIARRLRIQLVNATDGGEGITMTPETRAKISAAQKGKKLSLETRSRMSISKTGKKRPTFSRRPHSQETKNKLGVARRLTCALKLLS